jgi:hypothetical protein
MERSGEYVCYVKGRMTGNVIVRSFMLSLELVLLFRICLLMDIFRHVIVRP